MTLRADVFPKLMLKKMSKKSCFTGPFDRQHNKWFETDLLITVNVISLVKVCFSDIKNRKPGC